MRSPRLILATLAVVAAPAAASPVEHPSQVDDSPPANFRDRARRRDRGCRRRARSHRPPRRDRRRPRRRDHRWHRVRTRPRSPDDHARERRGADLRISPAAGTRVERTLALPDRSRGARGADLVCRHEPRARSDERGARRAPAASAGLRDPAGRRAATHGAAAPRRRYGWPPRSASSRRSASIASPARTSRSAPGCTRSSVSPTHRRCSASAASSTSSDTARPACRSAASPRSPAACARSRSAASSPAHRMTSPACRSAASSPRAERNRRRPPDRRHREHREGSRARPADRRHRERRRPRARRADRPRQRRRQAAAACRSASSTSPRTATTHIRSASSTTRRTAASRSTAGSSRRSVSAVALRHGTRHIHNVWGIAWSPDHDHLLAGAGLGFHANLTGGLGFDLDAMNWWTNVWDGELRSAQPAPRVGLAAPSAASSCSAAPPRTSTSATRWTRARTSIRSRHARS